MTHWHSEHRTARAEHKCGCCGRTIRKGERYRRGVGLDGTAWTWKECAHCDVLARHVCDAYDLDEYDPDSIADYDAEDLGELRVKVGFRRRWTRSDGSLYPVPVRSDPRQVTYCDGAFSRTVYGPIRFASESGGSE